MSNRKNKAKNLKPLQASDKPNLNGEVVEAGGAPVSCGGTTCCNSAVEARFACGVLYGPEVGFSNTSAHQIPRENKNFVDCGRGGAPYECRTIRTANCSHLRPWGWNKEGPHGSFKNYYQVIDTGLSTQAELDRQCRDLNGPNSQFTRIPGATGGGQCDIYDWKTEHTEECCTPGTAPAPEAYCSPQTCFGKPACDDSQYTLQYCSDKDNIMTDQSCIDTCFRANARGGKSMCNAKIKDYCQGKNLETEACRQYCSASDLDNNRELADFCDASYSQYCKSTDYSLYSRERQDQLCPCINSPLPIANCVDNKCTNGIGIKTKLLRENKCGGNICISQIYIDVKTGNPIIDIDRVKFEQYCPGVVPPWDVKPKTVQNLEWYIGGPVLLTLVVVALVFLFKK